MIEQSLRTTSSMTQTEKGGPRANYLPEVARLATMQTRMKKTMVTRVSTAKKTKKTNLMNWKKNMTKSSVLNKKRGPLPISAVVAALEVANVGVSKIARPLHRVNFGSELRMMLS
jgi:hypothetical protein